MRLMTGQLAMAVCPCKIIWLWFASLLFSLQHQNNHVHLRVNRTFTVEEFVISFMTPACTMLGCSLPTTSKNSWFRTGRMALTISYVTMFPGQVYAGGPNTELASEFTSFADKVMIRYPPEPASGIHAIGYFMSDFETHNHSSPSSPSTWTIRKAAWSLPCRPTRPKEASQSWSSAERQTRDLGTFQHSATSCSCSSGPRSSCSWLQSADPSTESTWPCAWTFSRQKRQAPNRFEEQEGWSSAQLRWSKSWCTCMQTLIYTQELFLMTNLFFEVVQSELLANKLLRLRQQVIAVSSLALGLFKVGNRLGIVDLVLGGAAHAQDKLHKVFFLKKKNSEQ